MVRIRRYRINIKVSAKARGNIMVKARRRVNVGQGCFILILALN